MMPTRKYLPPGTVDQLPPAALERLVRQVLAGIPAGRPRELPIFIYHDGPFLARTYPARLLRLPPRTAYALVRAYHSPSVRWPPYSPTQDWVLRATCDALYTSLDLQQEIDRARQEEAAAH